MASAIDNARSNLALPVTAAGGRSAPSPTLPLGDAQSSQASAPMSYPPPSPSSPTTEGAPVGKTASADDEKAADWMPTMERKADAGDAMDGLPECPDQRASWLSILSFHWVNALLWRGYKRPLEKTNLWSQPASRSSRLLADHLDAAVEKRRRAVRDWNAAIDDGSYQPSALRRAWWLVGSRLGLVSRDGRRNFGIFKALYVGTSWSASSCLSCRSSLHHALSVHRHVVQLYGVERCTFADDAVLSTTTTIFSTFVVRYLITHGAREWYSERGVPGYTTPSQAAGIGAAIGLYLMTAF